MLESDFLQIGVCTTNRSVVAYLNVMDEQFSRVDVTEDYAYEKKQILDM